VTLIESTQLIHLVNTLNYVVQEHLIWFHQLYIVWYIQRIMVHIQS